MTIAMMKMRDVPKYNLERFKCGGTHMICTSCGHEVNMETSYSSQGKNVTCTYCVRENSKKANLSEYEYVMKYIHEFDMEDE